MATAPIRLVAGRRRAAAGGQLGAGGRGSGRGFAAVVVAPIPAVGAAAVDAGAALALMIATPLLLFWRPSMSPIRMSCVAVLQQRVGCGRHAAPASMFATPGLFEKRPARLPMIDTSLTIDGNHHGHLG